MEEGQMETGENFYCRLSDRPKIEGGAEGFSVTNQVTRFVNQVDICKPSDDFCFYGAMKVNLAK